jgi:hypothetical protein
VDHQLHPAALVEKALRDQRLLRRHRARSKPARRQKDISYAFALSNGRVLLTQRGADAALMPGMWELPEATGSGEVLMRLRHAITTTDYRITIVAAQERGHWIRLPRVRALPLTGVTRKVLRCLGII